MVFLKSGSKEYQIAKKNNLITQAYRVIRNDRWGFNNLSYTIHLR